MAERSEFSNGKRWRRLAAAAGGRVSRASTVGCALPCTTRPRRTAVDGPSRRALHAVLLRVRRAVDVAVIAVIGTVLVGCAALCERRSGDRDHGGRGKGGEVSQLAAAGRRERPRCQERDRGGDDSELQRRRRTSRTAAGSGVQRLGPTGGPTVRESAHAPTMAAFPAAPAASSRAEGTVIMSAAQTAWARAVTPKSSPNGA